MRYSSRISLWGGLSFIEILTSCSVGCGWPTDDAYITKNETSHPFVAFTDPIYHGEEDHYMAKGESRGFSIADASPSYVEVHPDRVSSIIVLKDCVIEMVPKMMTDDVVYNVFSGLAEWVEHWTTSSDLATDVYSLTLTDERVSFIANRMSSKGLPPYSIVREEIVNGTNNNITITPMAHGVSFDNIRVGAYDTVAVAKVGLLFDCDSFRIRWNSREVESDSIFAKAFPSRTYRYDDSGSGFRRYWLTDYRLGLLIGE